jgi:DNA-binding NtrC family response regulator
MSISVLVVDHHEPQQEAMVRLFESRGDVVRTATTASEARIAHTEHSPDVVIISLPLGDAHQGSLPSLLLDADPHLGVIVLVESGAAALAGDSVQRGAICLERPVKLETLIAVAERAASIVRMRAELAYRRRAERLRAALPAGVDMLVDLAARNADAPVLIVGESGSGKRMVARLVHDLSRKAGAPFITLQCEAGAQAEAVGRTLFGSERGFSADSHGAVIGLVEMADSGSVLVHSVTDLPYDTQNMLLHFIETGSFSRAGGSVKLRSGARIMASAVRPLATVVDAGTFRADLFYRLQVLTIALPPLRERRGDLDRLVHLLMPPGRKLSPSAMLALREHSWPGNVRELENVLWRAALASAGELIDLRHLPLSAGATELRQVLPEAADARTLSSLSLAELERRAILAALEQTGGNKLRAAALLGIARSTLHEKLRRL